MVGPTGPFKKMKSPYDGLVMGRGKGQRAMALTENETVTDAPVATVVLASSQVGDKGHKAERRTGHHRLRIL